MHAQSVSSESNASTGPADHSDIAAELDQLRKRARPNYLAAAFFAVLIVACFLFPSNSILLTARVDGQDVLRFEGFFFGLLLFCLFRSLVPSVQNRMLLKLAERVAARKNG